jgi:hypothetical protein
MKAARVLLLSAGVVAILLLVALGLALSSPVQTWAARRALAQRPDLNASLGKVSAGLQRVELTALQLESNGAVLTLPHLDARLSLVSAGLRDRVFIESVVARDWTLDLTAAKSTGVKTALTPARSGSSESGREFSLMSTARAADVDSAAVVPWFRGVLAELKLPVDFSLDGAVFEGQVIVRGLEDGTTQVLKVTLRGGGLAAGKDGSFKLNVAGTKPDGGTLSLDSDLRAGMDSPRTFSRFEANALARASGPQFPSGVALNIATAVKRNAGGETYTLDLLEEKGKQLADVEAELVYAHSKISGTWKLDVHDTDLSPFLLGQSLPTFAATGQGNFETGTALKEVHASGRLDASASRLESFRPELSVIGNINLSADFDVLQHGQSLRIERLDATIAGTNPVGKIQALQPFELDLDTGELHVADPAKDLVGLVLTGLPVAWTRPFTGEFVVSGGDIRGEFAASARDGGLALRSKVPLVAESLNLAQEGKPLLNNVSLMLNASADYTPRGWQTEIRELTLTSANASLLKLEAKAGRLASSAEGIKATGTWASDLPAWAAQPVASTYLQVATGRAAGEFTASMEGTKALETKLALTGLTTLSNETLPAITAELRADVAPDLKTNFSAPILFEQGERKSDLLVLGTLTPKVSGAIIDGKVVGQQIYLEDVKLLGLVAGGAGEDAESKEKPDTEPFWGDVEGQLTLSIKKLIYGDNFEVTDVAGTLRLEATGLRLDGGQAIFGADSDLKLAGGLTFDRSVKEPYALAADLTLTNFDTTLAFAALDAAKLPTVETLVNLNSRITGRGANVEEVAERSRGDVQVTAKSGIFRALSADMSDKVQRTQSTVAALGGLLGAVTGKKDIADYANKTQILSDIAKALSEIPFDQLNVTATRAENLDIVLKDFTLISPEVRLTGTGAITYAAGLSVLAQPLALQLSLGARGRLAELLERAGLLDTTQDSLGYAAFSMPIRLSGSLANTDTSELRNALLNSALERSGLLDSILGK